jgi:hypothetical protein
MFVDLIAVVVAVTGLAAAIIARKIWLMVEGDLADSWRWILPSVPIYAISFTILTTYDFLQKFKVVQPVLKANIDVNLLEKQTVFSMQVWEPIILVLRNIQALAEMAFLILVLVGLIRQYKLFQQLASKQD